MFLSRCFKKYTEKTAKSLGFSPFPVYFCILCHILNKKSLPKGRLSNFWLFRKIAHIIISAIREKLYGESVFFEITDIEVGYFVFASVGFFY